MGGEIQNGDAADNSYRTKYGCLGFSTASPLTVEFLCLLLYNYN